MASKTAEVEALQGGSLWARVDARIASSDGANAKPGKTEKPIEARRFRWVVDSILPLSLIIAATVAVLLPRSLPFPARVALLAFAVAAILWSTTSLNAAYVALAVTVLMILAGGSPQDRLFDALASDVVWLMIGAFILGGAVQSTGLAARLTGVVIGRKRKVSSMFWMLTAALVPLSFFIPSTSGRAAVTLPVFRSIAAATEDKSIIRALALLIPTVILVAKKSGGITQNDHPLANESDSHGE